MNLRPLIGAVGLATVLAITATAAGAQTLPAPTPNAKYDYREKSLANVARYATQTGKMIARLQADTNGYGGHRIAAINSLQTAQGELNAAAEYAVSHGYQMPVQHPSNHVPKGNRTHQQSDWSIEKAQATVGRWITRLQNDSRDFGGHRGAAINALQQAESELGAASQYAASHGN